MTDAPPPPSDPTGGSAPPPPPTQTPAPTPVPAPPAAPSVPAGYYLPPQGVVPTDLDGAFHKTGLTILLTIVTLTVWGYLWTYHTNEELKKYNGDGLGGVLGVVIAFLVYPVLMFTIPNEIQKLYQRDGRQSPVSPIWGLWFLLPIIGNIIWYVKVQRSVNDFWRSKGAARV